MTILSSEKRLKKELTLLNIYMIATGATIADGIFLLPGLAFSEAGPAMILSYLIAVIPVIPALFSTAELSTAMPRAGGVYFFLDRSMGPLMGTIGGLGTWLALILKTSFALIGIGAYMSLFFPEVPMLPLAIFFAIGFGILNLLGAKRAGFFQNILVIGLLAILGVFSFSGIFRLDAQNFSNFFGSGVHKIFTTAGLVYVSYVGLSKIASVSEEVKNPDRNLPLAMFLALGTAVIVYILGTMVIIGVVPAEQLNNALTPAATAADILMGRWGAILITCAAIFAFFSVSNVGILSCSRYPLAMSRDHLLPRFLRIFSKQRTPIYSILLTVVLVLLILVLFDPAKIAKLAGAFQLLLFSLISLAVIVMRESQLASYDPGFHSPFYPWMQIIGILSPLWLIIEMGWLPSIFMLIFILLGTSWYFFYARNKVVRDGAIYHIFARLGQRRFEGLDVELRSILKEKGLRDYDPFDTVVANAGLIDLEQAPSFIEIVRQASAELSLKLKCDSKLLEKMFMEGTQVGATPVSHGAALPHIRVKGTEHSELIMVRVQKGVQFDISNEFLGEQDIGKPIFAFFFLASPEDNPGQHLRILAQIASHVDDENFLGKWLDAKNIQELKELLLREDRYISLTLAKGTQTEELIDDEVKNLRLPPGCLIILIKRQDDFIVPTGNTRLEEHDRLTITGEPKGIQLLYNSFYKAE